jgi:AraC-like DNA-binding protein
MPRRVVVLQRRNYFDDQRSPVAVQRMPRQLPIEQHRHAFFEIAVVLSGGAIHVTGDSRQRIDAGDVLFLNLRQAHGYEQTESLNLLNILVRSDALARLGRELGDRPGYHALFSFGPARGELGFRRRLHLSPAELAQIEEWASRIEEERSGPAARAGLLEEAYLTLIIDVLSRKYGQSLRRDRAGSSGPLTAPHLQARLGRILSWIEVHLAEPQRVADLAARAGMSPRTFHRAFLATTGLSPHAYVMQARLTRATQRLLGAPVGESITETAQGCGFNDSNYFARCFHRFSGATPREYRKRRGALKGAALRDRANPGNAAVTGARPRAAAARRRGARRDCRRR